MGNCCLQAKFESSDYEDKKQPSVQAVHELEGGTRANQQKKLPEMNGGEEKVVDT